MRNEISKSSNTLIWVMGVVGIAFVVLVAAILLFTSTKDIFVDAIFI